MNTKNIPLLFLCICLYVVSIQATEIAVVAKIVGTVTYQDKGATQWKSLKMGTILNNEAMVRTGTDGFATMLYLDDKSSVKMRPKTELKISGNRNRGAIEKNVKMSFGEVAFEVSKTGRQFRVETPTSVASVKGTKFIVVISMETKSTTVYGLTGIVDVSRFDGVGASQNVTTRTKAFVNELESVVKDSLTAEEYQKVEEFFRSIENGDTSRVFSFEIGTDSAGEDSTFIFEPNVNGVCTKPDSWKLNRSLKISCEPVTGYSFGRWQVITGDVEIDDPELATTSVKIRSKAAVRVRAICYQVQHLTIELDASNGARKSVTVEYVDTKPQ